MFYCFWGNGKVKNALEKNTVRYLDPFNIVPDYWKEEGSKMSSVGDPNRIFGPPRSGAGSVSTRYGSGSGSFVHQAKIGKKTLIPTVLWLLYDFLSLKNYGNLASKSNKQKNLSYLFCLSKLTPTMDILQYWISLQVKNYCGIQTNIVMETLYLVIFIGLCSKMWRTSSWNGT